MKKVHLHLAESKISKIAVLVIVLEAMELHYIKHTELCQRALILVDKLFGLSSNQKNQRDNENICLEHFMINCKEA